MIETTSLRLTFIYVLALSIFFALLSYFNISYQFYIWEIFVDVKIVLLVLFLLFLRKKGKYRFSGSVLKKWNLKKNFLWFFIPLVFYTFIAIVGVIVGEVSVDIPENAETLLLATIFDIPAVFVFSVTSIFIEEIFFRGVLVTSFEQIYGSEGLSDKIKTISITSVLFVFFNLSEVISTNSRSAISVTLLVMYFFSIGILTSILVLKYRTIWFGYSFRIFLSTVPTLILPSFFVDSDLFFRTKNFLFFSEGLLFSSLVFGMCVHMMSKLVNRNFANNNFNQR